jgi:hypothetical protein
MAYGTDARKEDGPSGMTSQPKGENWKKWSQLVAQTWVDENLKKRLKDNPAAVLQEYGLPVPEGVDVRVVESTDKVTYLMLPPKPAESELTSNQLAGVVGGALPKFDGTVGGFVKSYCGLDVYYYVGGWMDGMAANNVK